MLKTLIWKEWNEKKAIIILLSLALFFGYILSVNHIIISDAPTYLDSALMTFMFGISLLIGGNAVSPEINAGTINFTLSQPISRTKIWGVKYFSTVLIFMCFIIINICLEYLFNPSLSTPSFSFRNSVDIREYSLWGNFIFKNLLYAVFMIGAFFFSCFIRSSIASIGLFLLAAGITAYSFDLFLNHEMIYTTNFLVKSGIIIIALLSISSWLIISRVKLKKIFLGIIILSILSFIVTLIPIKEYNYSKEYGIYKKITMKYKKNADRIKKIEIEDINSADLLLGFSQMDFRYTGTGEYFERNTGDMIKKYAFLKKAIDLKPDDPVSYIRFLLMSKYIFKKYYDYKQNTKYDADFTQIKYSLEKASKIDSNNAFVDYIYGYYLIKSGNIEKGVKHIEEGLHKKSFNTYDFEVWHKRIELLKYFGIPESDALILDQGYDSSGNKRQIIAEICRLLLDLAENNILFHNYNLAGKYYGILLKLENASKLDDEIRNEIYRSLRFYYKVVKKSIPDNIENNSKRINNNENRFRVKKYEDNITEEKMKENIYRRFNGKGE